MRAIARVLSGIVRSIYWFLSSLSTWLFVFVAVVGVGGSIVIFRREPPIYVVVAARDLPPYSILTAADLKLVLVTAPPADAVIDKTATIGDATTRPIVQETMLTREAVVDLPPEAVNWTTVTVAQSPTSPIGVGVPSTIMGIAGDGQSTVVSQRAVAIGTLPAGLVLALPPEEALLLESDLAANGRIFVERRPGAVSK